MDEQQKSATVVDDDDELISHSTDNITVQQVYVDANTSSFGTVKELQPGYCCVSFTPNSSMKIDSLGLVHAGYLVSSANYAAMCAVNELAAIPIAVNCHFLAPFELGNTIEFKAQMLQSDTKKREVQVDGYVLDIKVFQAMFEVAVFDHHVFKLQITGPKKFDD